MHGFSKRRWEPCYLGGSVKKNSDVKRKTVKKKTYQ